MLMYPMLNQMILCLFGGPSDLSLPPIYGHHAARHVWERGVIQIIKLYVLNICVITVELSGDNLFIFVEPRDIEMHQPWQEGTKASIAR